MNKKIYVIRHGKAESFGLVAGDFNRTLVPRGASEAKLAGKELKLRGAKPDLMIASPAPRALYTLRLIASSMKLDPEQIITDGSIYEGSLSDLLNLIRAFPDTAEEALLCGHNPGVTELAGALYGGYCGAIGTAGILAFTLQSEHWCDAGIIESHLDWQFNSNQRA